MTTVPLFISHRLKGFDTHDASASGLAKALKTEINAIEIDIRISKDNQLVINHDAHFTLGNTKNILLANYTLPEILSLCSETYPDYSILAFSEFLERIKPSKAQVFIDIKEYGQEEMILQTLKDCDLLERSTIVSWLPETVLKCHSLNPAIPLCFSYYPALSMLHYFLQKFPLSIANSISRLKDKRPYFKTNYFYNSCARTDFPTYDSMDYRGTDHEHFVKGTISGPLLEAIVSSHGYICIHRAACTSGIFRAYKELKVKCMVYGIKDEDELRNALAFHPDAVLVDSPALLDAAKSI